MTSRFHCLGTLSCALAILVAASAAAQSAAPEAPPHQHHEGMDMGQAGDHASHDMAMHDMKGQLGPYPMSREASGTSWQPEATPVEMRETMRGDWSLSLHGFASLVYDRQTGPRGGGKGFSESMLMGMATRPLGPGTFGMRAMVSLDPLMGKSGYPLLLQTGESPDGKTPLIDRQHPHDAFMELSASYSLPLGKEGAAFVYAGLPGEPALGPVTFMHRYSGMRNPEAPIAHHWFDATHVTFGVVTAGVIEGPWKVEASWFNGREPDERRWNIETRRFDSWSARLTWNPTREWSGQASYGHLKSPEALEPEASVRRLTASATWQTRLAGRDWATTLAWARNDKRGPEGRLLSPALLLESTYVVAERHTVFGRFEQVDKDELFSPGDPQHGQSFRVRKLSLGYIHDFASAGPLRWGLGGVVGWPRVPAALEAAYGRDPMSYLLFLQARIAP
jgi:hypothetical protein